MVTGAQSLGKVAIDLPALMQVSPAGRAHHLKEERVGQSAAAENSLLQRAAERVYIHEKG